MGSSRTALVVTPSLEAYGSDLQMLQSVAGLLDAGWRVVVAASAPGRLSDRLIQLGATIEELDFPVLRRANASGAGVAALAITALRSMPRLVRLIRRTRPDVLYVNTVTLPWWLAAGRLARVPTVCHVHEAEARDSPAVRRALTMPLLLATSVIANSRTTEATLLDAVPRLGSRIRRVSNGVEAPDREPTPPAMQPPIRLTVVGRLSPRKAPEVALEAAALLRARGYDVILDLVGTPVAGMEWFEEQLLTRAARPDLAGAVTFSGYASPIWPALDRSDIVLAPSLGESFGNAVVEGQLARRPVVATALQGHLETIVDEETGLLVPSEDPEALAAAVSRLLDEPDLASRLAARGRESALRDFSQSRYRDEICAVLSDMITSGD
jgi:glycosyltransferase involved in cell wall biosynthesis